jgi:hypothetical protein
LFGSGFQRRTFPFVWVPRLSPASATSFLYQLQLSTDRVRVRVTLRLSIYRQSVRLGAKTLDVHDQRFFQLNTYGHRPYVTSSLTRWWICLLWIGFAFVKCTYCTCSMLLKFLPCALYTSPALCQSRLCKADHVYLTYLCYNGSSVTSLNNGGITWSGVFYVVRAEDLQRGLSRKVRRTFSALSTD